MIVIANQLTGDVRMENKTMTNADRTMERLDPQLAYTYINKRYSVSTMYRQSSAMLNPCWYYESIVWKHSGKDREILSGPHDAGSDAQSAFKTHCDLCEQLVGDIVSDGSYSESKIEDQREELERMWRECPNKDTATKEESDGNI